MSARAVDVVIVGGGIAGSACARALAEGGLSVAVIDRRPLERAGARWVYPERPDLDLLSRYEASVAAIVGVRPAPIA